MTLSTLVRLTVASLALSACSPATHPTPPVAAPERLSDTGLYADIATRQIASDAWPFEPQYPLWTDGATKRRWIHVPRGKWIDASDPDAWVFPVGTKLWKEFSFEGRVETRLLEKRSDGSWLRVSYVWNEDESDALLAPEGGVPGAAQAAAGVPYDVPARADCATCHAHGDGVLGFGTLQLSADRDPLAPHASRELLAGQDLAAFVERGLVRGLPKRYLADPPRIQARTPRERAVLGYLSSNCGSCHWNGGLLAGLDLELDAALASVQPPALATTVDRPSRFRPGDAPDCEVRIRPGTPELSALLYRMATREPLKQMPPLGTRIPDTEALALIEAWIRADLADSTVSDSKP